MHVIKRYLPGWTNSIKVALPLDQAEAAVCQLCVDWISAPLVFLCCVWWPVLMLCIVCLVLQIFAFYHSFSQQMFSEHLL